MFQDSLSTDIRTESALPSAVGDRQGRRTRHDAARVYIHATLSALRHDARTYARTHG